MSEEKKDNSFKVVLLGESGVGKTCIIDRFINDKFELDTLPTKAASFGAKTITIDENEGKSLQFNIWDTAGQEKFRSLSRIFYKDASAAILVYDITNKKSFEEIKNYWVGQLKEHAQENINKFLF